MAVNDAILLMSKSMVICATIYEKMMAKIGSSLLLLALLKIVNPGTKLSREIACNSLAEPMRPESDEKKEAANSPSNTRVPDTFVWRFQPRS